jgi:O-antigen ligase
MVVSRLPEFLGPLARIRPLLILAFVVGIFAFNLSRSRLPVVLATREMRAVFGILALATITIPTSLWPGESLRMVLFAFSKTTIFVFLLLYCVRSFSELRHLVFVGAAAAAGTLGVAIVLLSAAGRAQVGGTYDPNDTAFVMVCLLPIVVMLMAVEKGWRRSILAPVVVLCLVTNIMTKSRGGFVALLVVALILIAKLPSRQAALKIGVVTGGLLIFVLFAPQSYWDRVATIWGGGSDAAQSDEYLRSGITPRWEIWKTGVRIMLENPVLGVGIGNFNIAEGMTHGGTKFGSGRWTAPHNSFTQIGAELGLIGLALITYLLYRGIGNCRAVIRATRRSPQLRYHFHLAQGLEASLYGYIVGGMALSHAYSDFFYFLIAVTVLLRWCTANGAAQLVDGSGGATTQAGVPWWRMPR